MPLDSLFIVIKTLWKLNRPLSKDLVELVAGMLNKPPIKFEEASDHIQAMYQLTQLGYNNIAPCCKIIWGQFQKGHYVYETLKERDRGIVVQCFGKAEYFWSYTS